jgi:ribosomal protein L16 Arg81 hydroxylase
MRSVVVPSDSETVEVLDVREGTVLYIPRGFLHEARTGTAHSVHLTVGIKTPTWSDLLREALADVATHDPRFRHALPLDLHSADRPETTELQFHL